MMDLLARDEKQRGTTEVLLTADWRIESKLALRWLDSLVRQPPGTLSANDFVTLLGWRRDLILTGKGLNAGPLISAQGPMLLAAACREATARDPAWWQEPGDGATGSPYAANTKKAEPSPWEKLPGELWDAFTAPTNLAGSALGAGSVADALVKSLPLRWQVTLQRGTWELYDDNATQRIRKYGKGAVGRSRIPPRMVLRARGARIGWMWQTGARVGTNSTRFPATAGAKSVAQALRMINADKMKMIPQGAYEAFKLRKLVTGAGAAFLLATVPQAIKDARDAHLFSDPNEAKWDDFLVKEAKNQSANVAGFAAGVAAGLALGAFGVTAAPAVLVAGMLVGAAAQAGFNAWGFSGDCEQMARAALMGK